MILQTEQAKSLFERRKAGESVIALAKEAGVEAKYLSSRFSNFSNAERKALGKTKRRGPKKTAHVYTDLPILSEKPKPQMKLETKASDNYAVILVPRMSLRSFLSDVYRADS